MTDAEMAKQLIENFNGYVIAKNSENQDQFVPQDHFYYYKELQTVYRKRPEDILGQLLNKVWDVELEKLEKHVFEYFNDLILTRPFESKSAWADGINKALKTYTDIRTDFPRIDDFFPRLLYSFLDKGLMSLSDIVWVEDKNAEDNPLIDGLYSLMGIVLKYHYDKTKNWQEVAAWFSKTSNKFYDLQDLMVETIESVSDDIKKIVGEQEGSIICALLFNDMDTFKKLSK